MDKVKLSSGEANIEFNPHDRKAMEKLMDEYSGYDYAFIGKNEHGETIDISILKEQISVNTYQNNGWTRKNVFYRDGTTTETFNGRWK